MNKTSKCYFLIHGLNHPLGAIHELRQAVCSFVAHWHLVPGDCISNPGGGETFSSFAFGLRSHDCHLPLN